jgi:hypothetical protein
VVSKPNHMAVIYIVLTMICSSILTLVPSPICLGGAGVLVWGVSASDRVAFWTPHQGTLQWVGCRVGRQLLGHEGCGALPVPPSTRHLIPYSCTGVPVGGSQVAWGLPSSVGGGSSGQG